MKSGFVAIIGRPNVGKSTLLNAIIGEKIAITADKPQTTRNRIRGIYNDEDCQIVFIDTPGVTRPRNKLGEYMESAALGALPDVDAVIFITDDTVRGGSGTERVRGTYNLTHEVCQIIRPPDRNDGQGEGGVAEDTDTGNAKIFSGGDGYIFEKLREVSMPKILVINKTDLMSPDDFKRTYDVCFKSGIFSDIIGTAATEGSNIDLTIDALKKYLHEGPRYFPEDMITDHPERFLVTEIIREKTLHFLHDEVPHGIAVEIEKYEEQPKITRISAVIYTEKKSHKGIIIGKDGRKLKGIGKAARTDIEKLTGAKVFLELWVKVKDNWRDSDFMLSSLGYKE